VGKLKGTLPMVFGFYLPNYQSTQLPNFARIFVILELKL